MRVSTRLTSCWRPSPATEEVQSSSSLLPIARCGTRTSRRPVHRRPRCSFEWARRSGDSSSFHTIPMFVFLCSVLKPLLIKAEPKILPTHKHRHCIPMMKMHLHVIDRFNRELHRVKAGAWSKSRGLSSFCAICTFVFRFSRCSERSLSHFGTKSIKIECGYTVPI